MIDKRQAAVDHLSELLERDELELDEYRALVDRVLAATTEVEVGLVLASVATARELPALVYRCDGNVIKDRPAVVPSAVEITCSSGVMKIDLSRAVFDDDVITLDIDCDTGVIAVILPRGMAVTIEESDNQAGVFNNRIRRGIPDPAAPRVLVHLRTRGGVVNLKQPWRRRRWR